MIDRLNLLKTGLFKCSELLAIYPKNLTLQSIQNQIEYLLELEQGKVSDRLRLKEIVIGVQTAREIEAMDNSAAEIFYQIASEAKNM